MRRRLNMPWHSPSQAALVTALGLRLAPRLAPLALPPFGSIHSASAHCIHPWRTQHHFQNAMCPTDLSFRQLLKTNGYTEIQKLAHSLSQNGYGGEALEVVRGAEREPGLEQWRRLAALYDPLAAGRSLDDRRQILSPPKAAKIDDLSHPIQAWENLEQRHR